MADEQPAEITSMLLTDGQRTALNEFDADILSAQASMGRAFMALQRAEAAKEAALRQILRERGLTGHWEHDGAALARKG